MKKLLTCVYFVIMSTFLFPIKLDTTFIFNLIITPAILQFIFKKIKFSHIWKLNFLGFLIRILLEYNELSLIKALNTKNIIIFLIVYPIMIYIIAKKVIKFP